MGGDYGFAWTPHGDYAKELTFFVTEVGFPPLDTLRCATKTGAEILGREKELGTLRPASSPTSSWSTATPSRTSASSRSIPLHRRDAGRYHQGRTARMIALLLLLADVYHVSPDGNDAHDGRSPAKAWRRSPRSTRRRFAPGDQILFARGGEWRESLKASSSGAPGQADRLRRLRQRRQAEIMG
jgi:hypothetical protein